MNANLAEPCTWSVIKTPVGWVMAIASKRGLRRVLIGANQKELIAEGLADYVQVSMTRDDAGMQRTMQTLDAITRGKPARGITTDVAGTAFQTTVWDALSDIPKGQTRSYAEIARKIRKPKAARAVASACASNPVALVVPCHRVIHSDGSISGYAWGVEVKEALLDAEGAQYRA